MKQVKPNAWNGHFAIVEHDTETGAERRQEITDEEWKWTQAAAAVIDSFFGGCCKGYEPTTTARP